MYYSWTSPLTLLFSNCIMHKNLNFRKVPTVRGGYPSHTFPLGYQYITFPPPNTPSHTFHLRAWLYLLTANS